MYNFDLTTISGFLAAIWQLAAGVLRLDPDAFGAAIMSPRGTQLAFAILFLGGVSITLGQSGVLFANRVKFRRFVLAIFADAGILAVSVLFWAASVWLIADVLFNHTLVFRDVLIVVGMSYAPMLFGFLVVLPYFGNLIYPLLRLWTFLALMTGVIATTPLKIWQALLCGILGWLLLELLAHLPILGIKRLDNWLWRTATGTPIRMNPEEAADRLARETEQALSAAGGKKTT